MFFNKFYFFITNKLLKKKLWIKYNNLSFNKTNRYYLLFKIIQFFLLRIRIWTFKSDTDPDKIRPDPQHWSWDSLFGGFSVAAAVSLLPT